MPVRIRPSAVAALVFVGALSALLSACDVLVGPTDPFGRQRVSGSWRITARATSSTCGSIGNEPFEMSVVQNGEILQFVVHLQGFGPVRYDGWVDRDGDFEVGHRTVLASRGIEDRATVDGRFGSRGQTLSGTEIETITDLRTGDRCRIHWAWSGRRS
ncbi:MAG TPA: hypothetical protein VJ982_10240 [Gemmatimonadota bacterium]|nr:hypothetical protein [Gemmatimonadota bacterium]